MELKKCATCLIEMTRDSFYMMNKSKISSYCKKCDNKRRQSVKVNSKTHKEYNRVYQNEYRKNDINKLKHNIRVRLNEYLVSKSKKSIELLGCSPVELKIYLENQFKDGMSWDNYGFYTWHIDHVIPLSSAKTEEEVYKLCHYTNLQPLWAIDNLKKNNKIISNEQVGI